MNNKSDEELVSEYRNGDEKAFVELLNNTKGIRASIIRHYSQMAKCYGLSSDDLEYELQYSLFEACRFYSCNGKFFSYAYKVAKSSILALIWKKRNNTYKGYKHDFKGIITTSLDELQTDNGETLSNIIEDGDACTAFEQIEHDIDKQLLKQDITKLFDTVLSDTEKRIIQWIYGFDSPRLNYNQISILTGYEIPSIINIENSILHKLRYSEKSKWFIIKYGTDYACDRLNEISSCDNQPIYCQIKLQIIESFDRIMEMYEVS